MTLGSQDALPSDQVFDLSSVTLPAYHLRRRRARLIYFGVMTFLVVVLLFDLSREGLLNAANAGFVALVVGFVAVLAFVMTLLPDKAGPPMTTLTFGPDRVWFSPRKGRDRDLPIGKPGFVVILEDQDPTAPVTNLNNEVAPGRPRFHVTGGAALRVPVTGDAYLALKVDLPQRGFELTTRPTPPKPGPPREFLVYKLPK